MSADLPNNSTKPAKTRRRRWWVLALCVLVAGWMVWRWMQPASYKLVGVYPVAAFDFQPCTAGFLTRPEATMFVLRDWRGEVLWRVKAPKPDLRGWKYSRYVRIEEIGLTPVISSNGEYFAAAVIKKRKIHLQVWHHERLLSDIKLQIPPHSQGANRSENSLLPTMGLRVLDDGSVYLWRIDDMSFPMYVFKDGKVLARGMIRDSLPGPIMLSPDAHVLTHPTICSAGHSVDFCSVQLTPPKLTFARKHSIGLYPEEITYHTIYMKGAILASDGSVYRGSGWVSKPNRWRFGSQAAGGMYAQQADGNKVRIFSPVTGDAWGLTLNDINCGGNATADGRFAICLSSRSLPRPLRMLRDLSGGAIPLKSRTLIIGTYERPGRLRATLRMPISTGGREYASFSTPGGFINSRSYLYVTLPGTSESRYLGSVYPAPDGRALAVMMWTDEEKPQAEVALFRY